MAGAPKAPAAVPWRVEIPVRPLCLALACTLLAAQPTAPYKPDWASLDARPLPAWFQDAKLGIFIHWGVYSVPAYTKKGGYAEWYYKGWKEGKPESAVVQFHARTYGKASYEDLAPRFTAELWDPKGWADLFVRSGARYVVLTSKHHDGYCLWPTAHRPGWNAMDVGPKRDLVGELTDAVRGAGLKMGLYYSLPEWTHPTYTWTFPQGGKDVKAYVAEHMLPQVKDLVSRYKPSVLWADGEWDHPDSVWRSPELVAWLYNQPSSQDLVLNDRWGSNTRFRHGGFDATEYTEGKDTGTRPWEECRGLGRSFGLNRNEALEDYQSAEQLIHMFARIVARGGNLLLNIGPAADGTIPVIMQERLLELGAWLKTNGAAVYGTRAWVHPGEGKDLLYTQGADGAVYVTALRWPGDTLRLPRLKAAPGSTVRLLGSEAALPWTYSVAQGTTVQLPCAPPDPKTHAFVFRVEGRSNEAAPVTLTVAGQPAAARTLILGPAEVRFTSATPGVQFAYTLDGTEPGPGSPRSSGTLRLTDGAKLRVRALREDLQASPVTALDVERATPAPAGKGLRTQPGLDVLQASGSWEKLPDFGALPGTTRTTAPSPTIAPLPRPEQAGLRFTGYFKAPKTGVYTFHLASDDGSRLSLGGRVLLDHDGFHNDAEVRSAPVALEAGLHPFLLDYFQGGGGATLRLEIEGPDLPRQPLPASLCHRNR